LQRYGNLVEEATGAPATVEVDDRALTLVDVA
jgi:hypothetical protein